MAFYRGFCPVLSGGVQESVDVVLDLGRLRSFFVRVSARGCPFGLWDGLPVVSSAMHQCTDCCLWYLAGSTEVFCEQESVKCSR